MYKFSNRSLQKLNTCTSSLQDLFNEVIKGFDCTIVEGHRPKEKQNEYFDKGKSRIRYPNGKHNRYPSQAVDVAPYLNGSVSWDMRHCLYFAGVVMGTARMMGIKIRGGSDWDMDNEAITDQDFQDLVHYEEIGGK